LENPHPHLAVHAPVDSGDVETPPMKRVLRDIFGGFWSLLTGMKITIQQFFKPQVTLHYPHQSLKMASRYRGHIILVREPETGKSLCIACKACEKACPSDCIVVDGLKREGEKKKSVTNFKLDFSKDYNQASTDKSSFFQIDLVKRLEEEGK
jgi:NADH-quinone oxidoreductase subunit I